jgi:hypothetical protein
MDKWRRLGDRDHPLPVVDSGPSASAAMFSGATPVNAITAHTLLVVVLCELGVWFTRGNEERLAVGGDAEGSP